MTGLRKRGKKNNIEDKTEKEAAQRRFFSLSLIVTAKKKKKSESILYKLTIDLLKYMRDINITKYISLLNL